MRSVSITEGEGYAWSVTVVDEAGNPKEIDGGTPTATAKRLGSTAEPVAGATSFGDSRTIYADLAPGALTAGLWRVQTWLTLDGEPQMLDEFQIAVGEANG